MTVTPLAPPRAAASAAPAGRLPYAFGQRFFLLLAAGLLLIVPAWLDPRVIAVLGAWNLLVFALWAVDLKRIPAGGAIEVARTWMSPLTLGRPSRVAIEVTSRAPRPLTIDLVDDVPPRLRQALPEARVDVEPGDSARLEYDVDPAERGDAAVGGVALRVRTRWSLAERWLSAPAGQTVRVFPDLQGARRQSMYLLRTRQVALEKRRAKVVGLGRDFESLRDYQPGDEPRDICWTVTARRARPVTRIYQPERSQAVWIVVDGGRLLRARTGERTKLDGMVDAALGLAEVALTTGDRVGLLTYGRRIHARLAPARGGRHLRAIVDALAIAPAEPAEAAHDAAAAAVMACQKQRALIVWLTDVAETAGVPDVIEGAARLAAGHVVIFGVTRPVEIAAAAAEAPSSEDGMYRMLASQEMLNRRDVLLRGVRQRGVLVVEMDPGAPAAPLIDQYLTVKERNLI